MNEFKGTPAPWTLEKESESHSVVNREFEGDEWCIAEVYKDTDIAVANAALISAAPDLLKCQTMGLQLSTPDFLDWLADRLVNVYGESPCVDFVLSLRSRAYLGRLAVAKALGEAK